MTCIQGLITDEREYIDPEARPFARKIKEIHRQGLMEGANLVEVVREFFTFLVELLCISISVCSAHKMKVFASFLCLGNRNPVQAFGFLPISPSKTCIVGQLICWLSIPSSILNKLNEGKKRGEKKD